MAISVTRLLAATTAFFVRRGGATVLPGVTRLTHGPVKDAQLDAARAHDFDDRRPPIRCAKK
ncbi:hypothetical protein BN2475_530056 [Paraburkholderia ribeironis]|uniref:Uncharacterized protein n=1 Tax=Paraburkholderia ribeironis TaxID=1247936 RepID=A0A1N7SDX6_9BURK|nr:hypothetical protein BN2475_530056 [Paraburkholderia ribeironis]